MSNIKIEGALESRLKNMPGGTPIAWDNADFPTPAEMYLSANTLFAEPDDRGYKDSPFIQRGIFTVAIHAPANQGRGLAGQKAEQIRKWFMRGTSAVIDGFAVNMERTPEITGGGMENGRYVKRVRIRFHATVDPLAA